MIDLAGRMSPTMTPLKPANASRPETASADGLEGDQHRQREEDIPRQVVERVGDRRPLERCEQRQPGKRIVHTVARLARAKKDYDAWPKSR